MEALVELQPRIHHSACWELIQCWELFKALFWTRSDFRKDRTTLISRTLQFDFGSHIFLLGYLESGTYLQRVNFDPTDEVVPQG
jgi:hypothetical protein